MHMVPEDVRMFSIDVFWLVRFLLDTWFFERTVFLFNVLVCIYESNFKTRVFETILQAHCLATFLNNGRIKYLHNKRFLLRET